MLYIIPATIAMIALSWAYFRFGDIPLVKALFVGLGALVVGLLVNATWMLGRSVFKKIETRDIKGLLISLITFVGIFFLKINVIWLIRASPGF